jgi:hypothetical protein
MEIFSADEANRAKGLIVSIIDGYEGNSVGETLDFLLTDVDDWEALSMELAGHAATLMIVMASILKVEPYELFERYIRSRP